MKVVVMAGAAGAGAFLTETDGDWTTQLEPLSGEVCQLRACWGGGAQKLSWMLKTTGQDLQFCMREAPLTSALAAQGLRGYTGYWMVSLAPAFPLNNLPESLPPAWMNLTNPGVCFYGGSGGIVGREGLWGPAMRRYVCSFLLIMLHDTLTWPEPKNGTLGTKWLLGLSPQSFSASLIFRHIHRGSTSCA